MIFRPAVASTSRSSHAASALASLGSVIEMAWRLADSSGIGILMIAVVGLLTSFWFNSERFSVTRTITLSARSMAGENDQRCSVTTLWRSADEKKLGSPAGAIISA